MIAIIVSAISIVALCVVAVLYVRLKKSHEELNKQFKKFVVGIMRAFMPLDPGTIDNVHRLVFLSDLPDDIIDKDLEERAAEAKRLYDESQYDPFGPLPDVAPLAALTTPVPAAAPAQPETPPAPAQPAQPETPVAPATQAQAPAPAETPHSGGDEIPAGTFEAPEGDGGGPVQTQQTTVIIEAAGGKTTKTNVPPGGTAVVTPTDDGAEVTVTKAEATGKATAKDATPAIFDEVSAHDVATTGRVDLVADLTLSEGEMTGPNTSKHRVRGGRVKITTEDPTAPAPAAG